MGACTVRRPMLLIGWGLGYWRTINAAAVRDISRSMRDQVRLEARRARAAVRRAPAAEADKSSAGKM